MGPPLAIGTPGRPMGRPYGGVCCIGNGVLSFMREPWSLRQGKRMNEETIAKR